MNGLRLPPPKTPPTRDELKAALQVLHFLSDYHRPNNVAWYVIMGARNLVSDAIAKTYE